MRWWPLKTPDVKRLFLRHLLDTEHTISYSAGVSIPRCPSGDTRVLLIDGTTKELRAIRVGDLIYGTAREPDGRRRLVRTRVVAHWQTVKRAMRVGLHAGNAIVAGPEHRFLTQGNVWKEVVRLGSGDLLFGTERRGALARTRPAIRYARAVSAPSAERVQGTTALAADLHPRQCNDTFFVADERYEIRAVEDLGFELLMFDITTGTGDFIANGVVSHNCNAAATS